MWYLQAIVQRPGTNNPNGFQPHRAIWAFAHQTKGITTPEQEYPTGQVVNKLADLLHSSPSNKHQNPPSVLH